jgi:hypothetical protein
MQSYNLRNAYTFILFHDKVAIQQKYNVLVTHIIYFSTRQLASLSDMSKQTTIALG